MSKDKHTPDYERIYLQPFAGDEGGHTWCSDRIGDDDIEYVRADQMPASRSNAVGVGMAIAAGIIMSCWGDEVQAEEILGAAGLTTVAAMRASGVETYDIRLCLPVLRTFRERAKAKAHGSKATLTAGEQVGVE